ncbi:TonB-dependent receptor [Methylophaga frappieri]|uniref:TonB-dependent receptor n=1 Tax=Methylophaga frappieri (strain ATCC BAA-2434 / DSM 25690 / JAM7) TaxID=754477 RepID=I1YI02_METFJ|nr:TonB-dependent receptor [Methylophaga frappieri]AFJ02545.1 TonB-dependent receptor [Methylophaga frappieri]
MGKRTVLYGLLFGAMAPGIAFSDDTTTELSPVIVTGQKIERTQMETVSSVRVVDSEELENGTRNDNLYELIEMLPNVTNTSGFNSLAIRGIANAGPTGADNGASTIGIYIDNGLLTARSIQDNAISTWDLESVEVLRGPQSTTSGRNSLAGEIRLKTKDPEFSSNGAVKAAYGEDNTYQTAIMQTGPITDNLAYRVTGDYQSTDGYVDNDILDDDDFNRNHNANMRGKLLYLLPSDGEVMLTLNHNRFKEHGDAAIDDNRSGRESRLNYPSRWRTESTTASLDIIQPLTDTLTFESRTGYVYSDFERDSDFDGSPGDGLLVQETDEYKFNQEFLLQYEKNRLRSVTGLFLAKGRLDDAYTTANVGLDPGIGFPILLNSSNFTEEEYKTAALFTDIDFQLTDKLTLLAGLRADYEKRESDVRTTIERAATYGPFDPTIDAGLAALIGPGQQSGDESYFNLLPKLGFNYMWSDTLSTGFVVQRGYRPGGVSTNPIRGQVQAYDEEFTTHYEASLRSLHLNNRLNFNVNVFFTDWKDQQVTIAPAGAIHPLDRFVVNAGESHLYGFEIEGKFAVNRRWDVFGGIGYSKTEFDKFENNGIDYKGEEFQYARNWTANLASTYRFDSGWFVNGNISYASEGEESLGTPNTELDAYALVNLKIGYEQDQWGAYLYANNLFDKDYRTERTASNSQYGSAVYGDPRVIGVVATLSW